jgi:hypothetical protein
MVSSLLVVRDSILALLCRNRRRGLSLKAVSGARGSDELLLPKDLSAVAFIQGQRNATHSFSKKDIESATTFLVHVIRFRRLIAFIGLGLPYPDGFEFEGYWLASKILAEPAT